MELDDSENRPGHEEGRGDDSRQEVAHTQTIPESFRDFAPSLAGPSGISWSPALPILPETMPLKPEPTTDADVRTWIRAVSPHVVSRGPGSSSVPAQIQLQAHVPGFLRKSNCRREKPQSRRAGARDIQEQPVRRTRRACDLDRAFRVPGHWDGVVRNPEGPRNSLVCPDVDTVRSIDPPPNGPETCDGPEGEQDDRSSRRSGQCSGSRHDSSRRVSCDECVGWKAPAMNTMLGNVVESFILRHTVETNSMCHRGPSGP